MKNNIIIITSVINTPSFKLSYSNIRSIFSINDRFNQTIQTIQSIKNKIPNSYIILIECSQLNENMTILLKENTDIFINLYNIEHLRNNIYSTSKSLGESTQTIYALQYILDNIDLNNILHIFKISGRYWLSNNFDYNIFDNNKWIIKPIQNNKSNILTAIYKLPKNYIKEYIDFMIKSNNLYKKCVGLEIVFAKFINTIPDEYKLFVSCIGLEGFVSIDGSKYNG